jgi:SAM-dependent methyltransferase
VPDPKDLRRLVPLPVKRSLSAVLNLADPLARASWRRRTNAAEPVPPRKLRAHVGAPRIADYVSDGRTTATEIESVLADHGRPIAGFDSICDLGCGSGRVLTQLRLGGHARVCGTDVDDEGIEWLRNHFPEVDARVNEAQPPTRFDDGSFDLLLSISVLTHLRADSQRAWLREVRRLLRPDGLALITVFGPEELERYRAGTRAWVPRGQLDRLRASPPLEEAGFVYAPEHRSVWNRWRYRGVEGDYGLAFWDRGHLRREWSELFEIEAIVPTSVNWRQDAVLVTPAGPR